MVLPIIPALVGVASGALASNAFSKKGTSTTDSHNYTDSRQIDITYPSYQIQIDSPMASQSTKKEAAQSIIPTNSGGNTIDFSQLVPVALILGGALIVKEVIR